MDRRTVIATICGTVAAGGIGAIVAAVGLPAGSKYFSIVMVPGFLGTILGLGGLINLLMTATPSSPSLNDNPILDDRPPPQSLNEQERALWLLKRARENASRARKIWGNNYARKAYFEIYAAIIGIKKAYNVGGPLVLSKDSDDPTFKDLLTVYIMYADLLYPLLEAGHIESAKRAAENFEVSRGFD